jgi:iron complex transport system ATP-binding protein
MSARDGDQPTLAAKDLCLAYDAREVVADLSVTIPSGQITVIVGSNACGKSTLLRTLARLLKPRRGAVLLDGTSIHRLPTREVATRLGGLPQSPVPRGHHRRRPRDRGRYPHQGWFRQWTAADRAAVDEALRQRVWIAP